MADHIIMSEKEARRYPIIKNLVDGKINGAGAAKQCGLSVRQVRRLKGRVGTNGAAGITHRLRGQPSNKSLSTPQVERMKTIISYQYRDFGPTFAAEKLGERHRIKVGVETLRNLMIDWKLWTPKPRKQNGQYHAWRERRAQYGELEQFDGSYHDWFEGRAPACCLLASIDDATGKITKLQFTGHEGVFLVYRFWKEYIENRGKPIAIYLDRHSTYKQNQKKNILDNPEALTQFEQAMKKLDVELVHAYSPQAKGRVERLFGTLQDRLVKELRLRGITTIAEANQYANEEFLLCFNEKFSVVAQKRGDLHRILTMAEKKTLPHIFAKHHTRRVLNDFTIRLENRWLQLEEKQPTLVCRKDGVAIEEWLDSTIHLYLNGKELAFQELPERPVKENAPRVTALTRKKSSWKPSPDHPWKQPFIRKKQTVEIY